MTKFVVLKPVVWNTKNYIGPSGEGAASGFPAKHGYGHEEWNNNPKWMWHGFKVFHTEAKGQMLRFAETGDLGILMTVATDNRFFAVGAACNVYSNTNDEMIEIAKELKLLKNEKELWQLEAVRNCKRNRAEFHRHWAKNHWWVRWKCPPTHFRWFTEPLPIDPSKITGKTAIVKMHAGYQGIRPQHALDIIGDALSNDHPIIGWLSTDDFELTESANKTKSASSGRRRVRNGLSAGTPNAAYRRYVSEYEVVVTPKHFKLQDSFTKYIKGQDASNVTPDKNRVDLTYKDAARGKVLVEVKPCEPETTRFAIRAAIGQLYDYRQMEKANPTLLIVLGAEPTTSFDKNLALSNGIGLAWPHSKNKFSITWPKAKTNKST